MYCENNQVGVVHHLIVHPRWHYFSHLVLLTNRIERLLPATLIHDFSEAGISLACTLADLETFPFFTETTFTEMLVPDYTVYEYNYLYPFPGSQTWLHIPVVHQHIPSEGFLISRPTQIESCNGHIGKFEGLIVDPETLKIQQLLCQRGHLWERKRLLLPAALIERFEGDTIYLSVQKSEL